MIGQSVLAQADGSAIKWITSDGHGSTRALIQSNGTVSQSFDYDAYGNAIGFDPTASQTNMLYTNQYLDSVLNEYQLRARYYDPSVGRFSSFDGFEGTDTDPLSLHKYAYTRLSPTNFVDPTGHWEFSVTGLLSAIGIDTSVDGIKDYKDAVIKHGIDDAKEELRDALSMDESNENAKLSRAAEVLWEVRLTELGFKAIPLQETSVGSHGPDMLAFGYFHGRFKVIVGEVKGLSSARGLSALGEWTDGTVQMSAKWINAYVSQIVDGFIKPIEQAISGSLPAPIGQLVYEALGHFQLEYYLLRARRYSGRGWKLSGAQLVHIGDTDVDLGGPLGSALNGTWPVATYLPDPAGL